MLGFCVFGTSLFASEKASQSVQLIKPASYNVHQNLEGWLMSEKFDGIRAYWDGQALFTKRGNIIHAPDFFISQLPPFALDGELWVGRQKFEEVASIVLDKTPTSDWQKVSYLIFEVPNQPGNLVTRLNVLNRYLSSNPVRFLKVIEQKSIHSHAQVQAYMKRLVEQGAEGLIIRDGNQPFGSGLSQNIQKIKPTQDAECIVKGYTPGKGKYKGLVGAILCEPVKGSFNLSRLNNLDNLNKPIKIGSGLTDDFRKQPPPTGSLVTFQYMGLTKNGLPRFPVFLRVRPVE